MRNMACREYFVPRQCDIFTHGTITLYSQGFVMFAGIYPSVAAGSTFTAVGVRIYGNTHARFESARNLLVIENSVLRIENYFYF